ncbi:hypothetical protein HDU99_000769 [Rhizoclosmatium hyalinum]|nr:hypothetical protein HDU99_000769 [Rhizoclosmatium hyalinum]
MSTRIDPALLNEFLSTLDEVDAEAVCNFIASYRGPDVVSAMYAHLAKIQDLRASEQILEEMPEKPLDWEALPLDINDVNRPLGSEKQVTIGGGRQFGSTTEDGLFSDENDVWDQTEGGRSAAESDWIMLDDISLKGLTPTLQHLPKKALTKILIYSQNSNLLKTSRRLARLPLPTLGSDLAQVILALIPSSLAAQTVPSSASSVASSDAASSSAGIATGANLNEILTRAAHSPYANRSPLTFPCLARLATSRFPRQQISIETLGAIIDIASKERRWNSVRGVLVLSKTLFPAPGGFGVVLGVDDFVQQFMRRPFVVGGNVFGCLVANVVANHGKSLDVLFFRDLVEEGGCLFGVDVVSLWVMLWGKFFSHTLKL